MISEYVNKLIENIPDKIKNRTTPLRIDLVLDGGAFNGSYLLGALYFLKEMEKRGYVKVERISGCSIGSLVGFLYLIDSLDSMVELYDKVFKEIRTNHNLNVLLKLKTLLKIPDDVSSRVNKRLYVTYNNLKKGTKPVKSTYKDVDDILDAIIKSCFIPFITDGNMLYKDKYVDGVNPYVFKCEPNKKILYLNLLGLNKIGHIWNVKNEQTNYHRLLSGLLDIHSFYIKQSNTEMCSYVEDWGVLRKSSQTMKFCIEKIILYIVRILVYLKNTVHIGDHIFYKLATKIIQDVYVIVLDTYCL